MATSQVKQALERNVSYNLWNRRHVTTRLADDGTYLGSQTDNLAPTLHAQVCADDPTNTRAQHLALVVQQHGGIIVEPDEAAIWPADSLPCAHDDSTADVALADLGGGGRCLARDGPGTLHDADNLVADATPAVVDLLLQDVDALDEECS